MKQVNDKIDESHISTHENRKNVLKYAMDDGEFTTDFGIQDVNLINYNDSPHQSKKAFTMKVQKTTDGSSLFKGRYDFNLFKWIRDNFSNHYSVCLEIYCQKSPFYSMEFNSFQISFEKMNINIDKRITKKVNSDYKYYRSILNLSPGSTSQLIQRRLYINVQCIFDNDSPNLLPIYVLIYGIKNEAKNDLDFSIYDYEKAYEISSNERFTMHMPIDMNGHTLHTSHFLHGYLNTNSNVKSFTINGSQKVLIPNNSTLTEIKIIYNSLRVTYKRLQIKIHYGFLLGQQNTYNTSSATQLQTFSINLSLALAHFQIQLLNTDVPNEELNILIEYKF